MEEKKARGVYNHKPEDTLDVKQGSVLGLYGGMISMSRLNVDINTLVTGDEITVTKWKNTSRGNLIGEKLTVVHVEDPFIIVEVEGIFDKLRETIHKDDAELMVPSPLFFIRQDAEIPWKNQRAAEHEKAVEKLHEEIELEKQKKAKEFAEAEAKIRARCNCAICSFI